MNDVDGGCTTLLSPVFDLAGAQEAVLRYWRWWYGVADSLSVEASSDGGSSWARLELVTGYWIQWREVALPLRCVIDLTSTVRFRFLACDLGADSIVEAAVDDMSVWRFDREPAGIATALLAGVGALRLAAVRPNPFTPAALVRYEVPERGRVKLAIYDVSGRSCARLRTGSWR